MPGPSKSAVRLEELTRQVPEVRNQQLILRCPLCGKEGHLYLHRKSAVWHCFRCERSGRLYFEIRNDPMQWRSWLKRYPGGATGVAPGRPPVETGRMYPLHPSWTGKGRPLGWNKAWGYLLGRGVDPAQIRDYLISLIPGSGRVWFPYWEEGSITWAVGRAIGDKEPKTLDVGDKDKPLYGSHVAPLGKQVALVEGAFDHLSTPHSVALMHSRVSEGQTFALKAAGVERAFCLFDPDAEGKARWNAVALNRAGVRAYAVGWRGTKKDPAELGRGPMSEAVEALFSLPRALRPQTLLLRPQGR